MSCHLGPPTSCGMWIKNQCKSHSVHPKLCHNMLLPPKLQTAHLHVHIKASKNIRFDLTVEFFTYHLNLPLKYFFSFYVYLDFDIGMLVTFKTHSLNFSDPLKHSRTSCAPTLGPHAEISMQKIQTESLKVYSMYI